MDELFFSEQISYDGNAVIKVVGVGGAGCNTVAKMIASNTDNAEYIAVDTDAQSLKASGANTCILIDRLGLDTGGRAEKGKTNWCSSYKHAG